MPKFRSKPTVIEAEQFHHPATSPLGVRTEEDGRAYVVTAHAQKVYLEPGDWIVPEPNGNGYYPIKPEIFAAKYELIETPPAPTDDRGAQRIRSIFTER